MLRAFTHRGHSAATVRLRVAGSDKRAGHSVHCRSLSIGGRGHSQKGSSGPPPATDDPIGENGRGCAADPASALGSRAAKIRVESYGLARVPSPRGWPGPACVGCAWSVAWLCIWCSVPRACQSLPAGSSRARRAFACPPAGGAIRLRLARGSCLGGLAVTGRMAFRGVCKSYSFSIARASWKRSARAGAVL